MKISIITPCFNEEDNIREVYEKIKQVMCGYYEYEHIFIDNCSTDRTPYILRELAENDKNLKVIFNSRNFGLISCYHALMQCTGDCAIQVVADLQDPPELIDRLIMEWLKGFKIVLAVKRNSEENPLMFAVRNFYYKLYNRISNIKITQNFCGFCLIDRSIIEILRKIDDPNPDFRSLIAEIGFEKAIIPYTQPKRKHGKTKNNLYQLYDFAMLGLTNNSIIPMRLASFIGFTVAFKSLLVALGYFIYKLIYWQSFQLGIAPLIVGIFFFAGVQLCFLGIIGEYIGAIFKQVKRRPLVIEKERINFD